MATRLVAKVTLADYLLGDGNYDKGALYGLATDLGGPLLGSLPPNAGRGHRRQSPTRLRAVGLWRSGVAGPIHRNRADVER